MHIIIITSIKSFHVGLLFYQLFVFQTGHCKLTKQHANFNDVQFFKTDLYKSLYNTRLLPVGIVGMSLSLSVSSVFAESGVTFNTVILVPVTWLSGLSGLFSYGPSYADTHAKRDVSSLSVGHEITPQYNTIQTICTMSVSWQNQRRGQSLVANGK